MLLAQQGHRECIAAVKRVLGRHALNFRKFRPRGNIWTVLTRPGQMRYLSA